MTARPTSELARFVAGLSYEAIPERTRERIKDILLDALASAIAGRQGDESKQIRALAAALGASHEATVIGGEPLSIAGATLLNGYLITAVTVCDVHRPTLCHTTPEVVPPALALAGPIAAPASHHVDELRRLGEIGYVRGIESKLAELDAEAGLIGFVAVLRDHLSRFDFERFNKTLDEVRNG